MKRTTILYIAPWLVEGGADKGTLDWFRYLDKEKYRKLLVTTYPAPSPWLDRVLPFADKVWDTHAQGVAPEKVSDLIAEIMWNERPELVHLMNSETGYDSVARIRGAASHPKIVAQFHTFDYLANGTRVGYAAWVPGRFDEYIDAYSVVSQNMAQELSRMYAVPAEKIHPIYLGTDLEAFSAAAQAQPAVLANRVEGKINLLWVGRMARQKNPGLLLQILKRLKDERKPVFIHVLGDGPERAAFEAALDRDQLRSHCRVYGFQDDMASWYRMADALLLTSQWEGVPLTLFESLACGLPCIAPNVGGIGELLDSRTGRLLSAGADAATYVEAIAQVSKPDVRQAASAAARRRAEAFPVQQMARMHDALYSRLIAAPAEAAVSR